MDIMEIMKGNRTYRRFLQEPIPEEAIGDMMEAARIANCGMNGQVLRYTVVTNPSVVAEINSKIKLGGAVPELKLPREGETPMAFIVITVEGEVNQIRDLDLGIAAHAITTVAYSHGVGSCIMWGFPRKDIKEMLNLDNDPQLMLALGKPAHKSTIVEPKDGALKYYADENLDFYVPKKPLDEIAEFNK